MHPFLLQHLIEAFGAVACVFVIITTAALNYLHHDKEKHSNLPVEEVEKVSLPSTESPAIDTDPIPRRHIHGIEDIRGFGYISNENAAYSKWQAAYDRLRYPQRAVMEYIDTTSFNDIDAAYIESKRRLDRLDRFHLRIRQQPFTDILRMKAQHVSALRTIAQEMGMTETAFTNHGAWKPEDLSGFDGYVRYLGYCEYMAAAIHDSLKKDLHVSPTITWDDLNIREPDTSAPVVIADVRRVHTLTKAAFNHLKG